MPHPEGRQVLAEASRMADEVEDNLPTAHLVSALVGVGNRLAGAMEKIADEATKAREVAEKRVDKHDDRIKDLEKWKWGMQSYITVLAAVFAVAGTVVAYVTVDEIRSMKQQLWNRPGAVGRER